MDFVYNWDAVSKPEISDEYFCFQSEHKLTLAPYKFSFSNALILGELCRLIYRRDDVVSIQGKSISFIETMLKDLGIESRLYFENEELATRAWLLNSTAKDAESGKDIPCQILVFRGTSSLENWKLNAKALHIEHAYHGSVHRGFYKAFMSLGAQILNRMEIRNAELPILITGHSLGGAMATLAMAELLNANIPVACCYTFGSPKVGDNHFADQFLGQNLFRVINRNDVVSRLPLNILNMQYQHAGESHYFSETEHHVGLDDEKIEQMQLADIPGMREFSGLDHLISLIRNYEGDVPSFFADHAPINYSARLDQMLTLKGS